MDQGGRGTWPSYRHFFLMWAVRDPISDFCSLLVFWDGNAEADGGAEDERRSTTRSCLVLSLCGRDGQQRLVLFGTQYYRLSVCLLCVLECTAGFEVLPEGQAHMAFLSTDRISSQPATPNIHQASR